MATSEEKPIEPTKELTEEEEEDNYIMEYDSNLNKDSENYDEVYKYEW